MSLPLPSVDADSPELDLPRKNIAITEPFVFVKIAHLLLVRVAELASARCNCAHHYFLPKY